MAAPLFASQEPESKSEEPELKVNATGQLLIDGATYISPQKSELFTDGLSIPEVRAGVRMTYGKWTGRVDIGYAYEKVGLKDIWLQYTFNEKNNVRIGSFIYQMGLNSAYGASMKPTMIEPVSNTVFNDVRLLGVMYTHSADKWMVAPSLHAEPSASKIMLRPDQMTKTGVGARFRAVARPLHSDGVIVQAGISGAVSTPQYSGTPDTHDSFSFGANFPTKVSQVKALDATVSNARNYFKFEPELLLSYHRIALESEYYFLQVNRHDNLTRFRGQGAYVTLRGILKGGDYPYNMEAAYIPKGKPKSLEALLNYNYTCISDARAGIFGGRMNEASFTLNYYINPYMIARLHYSYSYTWDCALRPPVTLSGIMLRLQAVF